MVGSFTEAEMAGIRDVSSQAKESVQRTCSSCGNRLIME